MRRPWMLLLVAGCGRIAFDPAGSPDGGRRIECASFGPWSTPVLATNISSTRAEFGPALSADSLEVVFHRDRGAGQGGYDLFRTTRPDRASELGDPDPLTDLNSPQNEENATLSADGLTVYFTSDRTGSSRVYRSERLDRTSPFAPPTRIDALGDLEGPELSADGTELFGSRNTASHDLYRVTELASANPVSERLTSLSSDTRNEFFPRSARTG